MKKDLASLYKKYQEIKSPKGQNMADGGKVEDEASTFKQLADAFQKAFSAPKPSPTPSPSNEDKYQKIREQNQKNVQDPQNNPSSNYYDPNMASGGIVGLQKVTQYADGGAVDALPKPSPSPQSQEERDAESEEITKNEDERKLISDEEAKPFNKGGKVEHDKKNLLQLKKAFDKFFSEEGKEKLHKGGKVKKTKKMADGGDVKPSPSPSPKPLSMGNLFDLPGEDKAADLVKQMPHFDDGGYTEASNAPAREMDLRQNVANSFSQSGNSATKNTESNPAPAASGDQPSIREFLGLAQGGQVKGYADGELVEPDKFVDTQTPEEEAQAAANVDNTGYAPEDYAAQQAADDSLAGQLQDETDELNNSPESLEDAESDMADRKTASENEDIPNDDSEETDDEGNTTIDGDKELANQQSALAALVAAQKSPQTQLQQAQQQRNANVANQEMQKAGALIGAGIAGRSGARVDPSQALNVISEGDKFVNLPVQNYEEQLANQQNDPNSAASQAMKQYMASKGFQIPPNASYSDMIKIAPFMAKDAGLQNAMQRAILSAQTKLATNQNTVNSANKRASDALQVKKELATLAKQNKSSQDQGRALTQTQQLLESARGNPAAAQAEKDLYAAQKANSLYGLYGDPDKLSPQLVQTMINEVAKISTGGVPTGHEQQALAPGTAESKLASLWSKLSNEPTPANAGAFMKQFKDYNDALSKDAQKVIQDKYGRVIETRKNQLNPADYQSLQDNYINRFKPASNDIPVDADLSKMTNGQLQDYIKFHGGQ